MKVHLVGCSHHHSPLALRERLAFSPLQTAEALDLFRQRYPRAEAVLLSTCNRIELYTASDDQDRVPSHHEAAEFLAAFHGLKLYDIFDDLFERTGEDAVRHLFTVAASLDSMVVGEPQILAQVKQAYQVATARNCAGPLTHAIFQAAVRVARRVANETTINQRRVSIPSVAVADFAKQIFESLADKQVLVIGGGEMAEETLLYLEQEGARRVAVVNRSPETAQALAARHQAAVVPWSQRTAALAEADLVVSTTGASQPIVTLDDFRAVEPARAQRPLFILDLAVPRDFDPRIGDELGVYLYSLDDLHAACEANRQARDRELPAALRIVEQETAGFMADLLHRQTGPIIKRLRDGWDVAKQDELRRLFNKLPSLDDRSRGEVEQAFDRLINKLLHPPLESLRDEARHGTPHLLLEAFKRLFQLRD